MKCNTSSMLLEKIEALRRLASFKWVKTPVNIVKKFPDTLEYNETYFKCFEYTFTYIHKQSPVCWIFEIIAIIYYPSLNYQDQLFGMKPIHQWNSHFESDKWKHAPFAASIARDSASDGGKDRLDRNSVCHVASARKHSIPVFAARDRAIYKLPAVWCGLKQFSPLGGNECIFHSIHTVDTNLWGPNRKLSALLNLTDQCGAMKT